MMPRIARETVIAPHLAPRKSLPVGRAPRVRSGHDWLPRIVPLLLIRQHRTSESSVRNQR